MNIPEEAIEKAARKIFEYDAPSHLPEEWEPLNKYAKFDYREQARAALSAAAPLIAAQAWEDVSDFLDREFGKGAGDFVHNNNPYPKEQP